MKTCFKKTRNLYFITSQRYSLGRNSFSVAESAVTGGIDILQMREKDLTHQESLRLAKKLSTLCKVNTIVFIVNDHPELAKEVNADGLHLGQEDLDRTPVCQARKLLGRNKIIGVSTHSLEQIKAANELDINYIAFGPLFKTRTKNYFLGTKDVKKAIELSRFPIVFIGGINTGNITNVLNLGAENIALISEIAAAKNISAKTKQLKKIIDEYPESHNNS
jgi:thiamine-phosphate pyrophosphorylase